MRAHVALALAALACGCKGRPAPREVDLAAAISLKESVDEAATRYAKEHPEVHVVTTYGASGELATRMARGAPVDLLASAGTEDALDGKADTECTMVTNTVVLIRRPDDALAGVTWEHLATDTAVTRVAIGLTPQVPAGVYAEEALRRLGELDALRPKLVRGANVRQVLDLVARGEADVGVVYATDVKTRPGVVLVGPPPVAAMPHIAYPLYVARGAARDAKELAAYLCGAEGREAMLDHGFLAP